MRLLWLADEHRILTKKRIKRKGVSHQVFTFEFEFGEGELAQLPGELKGSEDWILGG